MLLNLLSSYIHKAITFIVSYLQTYSILSADINQHFVLIRRLFMRKVTGSLADEK